MTALTQLVVDLSKLEAELSRFETRFGVKSQEFYEAMMRGDLEEFDALDDYRMAFIEWLALYKTWLSLDQKYHEGSGAGCDGSASQAHPSGHKTSPRHRAGAVFYKAQPALPHSRD